MAYARGPSIEKDSLLLYLDAANPKSFKGEPTTNIVTNTNLDTGWSKGYTQDILWNDISPPAHVDSPVVSFIDNVATSDASYWYSYGDYAPQLASTTYTISLWVRTEAGGTNFGVEAYTADNSEIGRKNAGIETIVADGKWQRIVWNPILTTSDNQSDSLSFRFSDTPQNQRIWLCAPQMEAKDHATTFTVGSRGTAVGKNLMRTGLDANSVGSIKENWSTGSQRTLEFDGATTLMNFGIGSDIFPQPEVSFEFLFNSFGTTATTGTSPGLIGFTYGARVFLRDDSIGFGLDDGTSIGLNYSSDGKNYRTNSGWIHVICTNDRVTSKVYTNGVKVLEFAEPWTGETRWPTNSINLGQDNNTTNYHFRGLISLFKVYGKALTGGEVSQNFNSVRGRFDI